MNNFSCTGRFQREVQEKIPAPDGPATNLTTIEEFWEALFTDEIFEQIVECTNTQIENVCAEMMAKDCIMQSYHHQTDLVEIKAYVGLLYFSGARKASNLDVHELWDKESGLTNYICVMSRNRFTFLSSCLRFDDKDTRNSNDRFAPIRQIFEIFIRNCQECYSMSEKVTVDEQLLSFRGRCKFRMYMKSKPDKYGLKLITLNDAKTAYLYNAIPYLGKTNPTDQDRNESHPEYCLRKILEPIYNSDRTVTCDNWFTSIPGMERFLDEPYSLTFTGTLRKNKREIPADFRVPSKEVPYTKFCFSQNITLISHTPKKNKIVLLASTFMKSTAVTEGKPEIILHYNKTKGGTDTFDQLCHSHTVTKRTNRWPMRYFFGMLDQAAVNARILLHSKMKIDDPHFKKTKASMCLRALAFHLYKPHLEKRMNKASLRTDLKLSIKAILSRNSPTSVEIPDNNDRPHSDVRVRCSICPRQNDRKTSMLCDTCQESMCDDHRMWRCVNCGADEE